DCEGSPVSIERRAFLTGAAALLAASSARAEEEYKDPASVAAEPDMPLWPPKERFALWPGSPPGAPKPLPRRRWTMREPAARQLWVLGTAMPEMNVFHPARRDRSG